jgi:transposase-like protein
MEEITIRGTKAQRNLMEWSRRVADCRSSGMSVTRWCTEHNVKRKTYYNWQKKVFAAMLAQQQAELSETAPRFAELPPPGDEKQLITAEKQRDLVASVRIGGASLDVYSGASAEIVSALCKVLCHAK